MTGRTVGYDIHPRDALRLLAALIDRMGGFVELHEKDVRYQNPNELRVEADLENRTVLVKLENVEALMSVPGVEL